MTSPIIDTLRAAGCVFAEDEAELLLAAAANPAELDAMVRQRVEGRPLEYILGWAEFCGLRIIVSPGVFVPRRRTELMVREALAVLTPHATVVDLGCGSGAVGAAVRATVDIELSAVDVDPAAVACAERNVGPVVRLGDLYQPLDRALRGRVDAILANAPYVPTDAIALMPPEARVHEHRVALDGGPDGLAIVRRTVAGAPAWLARSGYLMIETSQDQAPVVAGLMAGRGLLARVSHDDDLDGTVVIGQLPG
jgi:release factor glutamine methyltransferase